MTNLNQCSCRKCNPKESESGTRFFVCTKCGNKRCPHATDHELACTNSNEPGQPGSVYGPPVDLTKLPSVCEDAIITRSRECGCLYTEEMNLAALAAISAYRREYVMPLVEGIAHLKVCAVCAEDAWGSCEQAQIIDTAITRIKETDNA